jgi:DNA polymerase kappa
MPSYIAKQLCPELICVPLNFPRYIEKAEEIRAILSKADPCYQAASLDEAYLNITTYANGLNMSPDEAVQELRAEIHQKTGLTVSAGIAANARLAKIGSNINKPNGQFRLANDRRTILNFMANLPIRKVNGIGKVFERQLNALGIEHCRDIYTHRALLSRLFGAKTFDYLLNVYLGTGPTNIRPSADRERKSIGTESTFRSISDPGLLRDRLRHTAEELEKDCVRADWQGRTLHLKLKKHTYEVYTRQCSLPKAIFKADELFAYSLPLLEKELPLDLRLMGLRLTHLCRISKPDLGGFFGIGEGSGEGPRRREADRDATFTIDHEELLEGDQGFEESHWDDGRDSVRKLTKLHNIEQPFSAQQPAQTCPICNRRVAGDINIHIDSCLNQGAIRETLAQDKQMSAGQEVSVEKLKAVETRPGTLRGWLKK